MTEANNFNNNFVEGESATFANPKSSKDYHATLLLCYFFGFLGAHRFYTGKIKTGIMLVTCGGIGMLMAPIGAILILLIGIWILIDLIIILTGNFKDKDGIKIVSDNIFFKTWSNVLIIVLITIQIILFVRLIQELAIMI